VKRAGAKLRRLTAGSLLAAESSGSVRGKHGGYTSHDLFWELCYSHYLYPAFLAAWSSGIPERLSQQPVSLEALAQQEKMPVDRLLALLPTLILFRMARQSRGGDAVAAGLGTRIECSDWLPMFRRHLESDEHVRRQLRLFRESGRRISREFWHDQLHYPSSCRLFLASIDAHSRGTAAAVADELRRAGTSTLVDVGSGLGTNAFAALGVSDCLEAVLVDLPPVIRKVCAVPDYRLYRSRMSVAAIDALTDEWPQSDGVFLLAHFLQDFGQLDRSRLLHRARAAMRPGAELWIHGHFWRGQRVATTMAAFGFYLYCHIGGYVLSLERQIFECREAGFRFIRSVQTSTTQHLLVFSSKNNTA